MLGVLQQQVTADNEENAILCVRMVLEFFKAYRPAPEEQIKSFLDLVISVRAASLRYLHIDLIPERSEGITNQ